MPDRAPLTPSQRNLLDFLLAAEFDGCDRLRDQAREAASGGSSCDCGCASFFLKVDPEINDPAAVGGVVPVDAHGQAADGSPVDVLLFVTDGYLAEIEIVWYGVVPPPDLPQPSQLTISSWSEPDGSGVRTLLNEPPDAGC